MLLFAIALVLVIAALFLRFGIRGYRFSSLVFLFLAAVLTSYGVLSLETYPGAALLRFLLTVCLCAGIAVVAVTEYFIIRAARHKPDTICSHVIVLGCLVRKDGPSRALRDRLEEAYRYLSAHPNTVAILSGGQGVDEDTPEAEAMFQWLRARGIPARRLIREDKSTSTWENLRFSLAALKEPPQRLGIISSDYHMLRTHLLCRKLKLQAQLIPAKTTSITHAIDHFLREAAGVWHFILLGGFYDH